MAEINCPSCNPEAKPFIRRLNKNSVCLICMNTGWTNYDKKCSKCGEDSGVYLTCNKCAESYYITPITISKQYSISTDLLNKINRYNI